MMNRISKKWIAVLAAAVLMMTAAAGAESAGLLEQISGKVFEFSSGVGAWGTELIIGENGAFTGSYHDSEMGETGEGYPDGSVYGCLFHGQFSDPVQTDEYSWTAKVALTPDEGQVPEAIEDGIRYVTASPYGLEKAQEVTFYLPGTPEDRLPEDFLFWSHLQETDPAAQVLPFYAIWSAADEAGFVSIDEVYSDEGAVDAMKGSFEDGCYVLTVMETGAGHWRADEMAQDDSVVRLASSGVENGVFTARYEPVGDGTVTVALRHLSDQDICFELYTFDLLVEGGQVKEAVGGSYTASPDEADLDPHISGEWLEKGTQFTELEISKKLEGGWQVEITSPLSHGAWKIRATAYYDCDYDAFVYADGVKVDLLPGEEVREVEAETGLWGTLRFSGSEDAPNLEWTGTQFPEGGSVLFEKAPGLPPYVYQGGDPIEGAVANALASGEHAAGFLTLPGSVTIPCPIIHRTEMIDDQHAKVFGSFWILNYAKRGDVLENISGGEFPGIITLEKKDGAWVFAAMEEAGDGDDYGPDIERFAAGDKALEEQYFNGANLDSEANRAVRIRLIRDYVQANGLEITAYQDYGWDPVPLGGEAAD